MKTLEYKFRDRAKWGSGAWDNEPDKVQFPDSKTGLPCLAVRGSGGSWCGYVGITEGHSLFAIDYGQCPIACEPDSGFYCQHDPEAVLDVHGGITFSGFCQEDRKERGICHIPEAGESDRVWWFGFDTAHHMDFVPGYTDWPSEYGEQYRTLGYIKSECAKLAGQLAS